MQFAFVLAETPAPISVFILHQILVLPVFLPELSGFYFYMFTS